MKPVTASAKSRATLGPAQKIGLFLAELLACLLRLRSSGATRVPPFIAHKVVAAEEIIQVYICDLAAKRLRDAGYARAARAIRTTRADYVLHLTPPDDMPTASPDELIAQLETTIARLNHAEALSEHFARLVFCALCMVFAGDEPPQSHPNARHEPFGECRVKGAVLPAHSPPKELSNTAQAPHPWPPPLRVPSAPSQAA